MKSNAQYSNANSRSTWGRIPARSMDELQKLCNDSFSRLQLPATWKIQGYDTCRHTEDPESEIYSIGMIILDTATSGIDTIRYRIAFHTYSERLHLCQKSIIDYGKYGYSCLISYQTPEQLNEFIKSYIESKSVD